jgi:hypothetical protein
VGQRRPVTIDMLRWDLADLRTVLSWCSQDLEQLAAKVPVPADEVAKVLARLDRALEVVIRLQDDIR